ncbi:hypothetical protein HMPREF1370_00834 [Enterococcus faecium P1123]|nr:hypothetical protein HMPREF1370_00834 [Enterococcus faecium P1123]
MVALLDYFFTLFSVHLFANSIIALLFSYANIQKIKPHPLKRAPPNFANAKLAKKWTGHFLANVSLIG